MFDEMEVNCSRCGKVMKVTKGFQPWELVKFHSLCDNCKPKVDNASEKAKKEIERTFTRRYYNCSYCNSTGKIKGYKCTNCSGTGKGPQSNFDDEMNELTRLIDKYST